MSDKDKHDAAKTETHPGMMGDGTEEQNLNQKGDSKARITEDEVNAAFAEKAKTDKPASK